MLSGIIDFLLAFGILLVMMIYYSVPITLKVIWFPVFLSLALVTSLGVGLWLSALNVQYRDVRYVVPFIAQFWMLATPIAYPSSLLNEPWRTVYGLNPMAGVVEGFRWALARRENLGRPSADRFFAGGGADPDRRGVLLPAHGKDFCRCRLKFAL